MAEEFVIKIIPDGNESAPTSNSSGSGSAFTGMGSAFKNMGSVIKGVLTGLGVASIVALIAQIVSMNKGLMSILGNIVKTIGYLLKPITDVIMVLLMPILMILKPIMILVNQMMAPFLKLAMNVMRDGQKMLSSGNASGAAGNFAAAGAIMIQGLSAIVVAVSTELLKLIMTSVGQLISVISSFLIESMFSLLTPILKIFGYTQEQINQSSELMKEFAGQGIMKGVEFINNNIDKAGAFAVASIASVSAFTSETVGTSADEFKTDVVDMITKVFTGAEGLSTTFENMIGTGQGFGKMANDAINGLLTDPDGISTKFQEGIDDFKTNGVSKISEAVNAFNDAFDNMKSSSSSGRSDKTFWGGVKQAVRNIGDDDEWWS